MKPGMFQQYTDPTTGETYTPTSGTGRRTRMAVASSITPSTHPETFDTPPRYRHTLNDRLHYHRMYARESD